MLKQIDQLQTWDRWPEAEQYLRKAVRNEDIEHYLTAQKAAVWSGMSQLWEISDLKEEVAGFAITRLYTEDGKTGIAQIYIAACDNLDLILSHMDEFKVWALKHGAGILEIIGRKGWEKITAPYGFKHNYTSLVAHITQEIH